MRIADDWTPLVETLGYKDEHTMLEDLYHVQGMSVHELAHKFGYSFNVIRRHLAHAQIEPRRRGGPNRQVTKRLREEPDEAFNDVEALAKKLNMHHSTIWKEKRRRGIQCISVRSALRQNSIYSAPATTNISSSHSTASERVEQSLEDILSGIRADAKLEITSS